MVDVTRRNSWKLKFCHSTTWQLHTLTTRWQQLRNLEPRKELEQKFSSLEHLYRHVPKISQVSFHLCCRRMLFPWNFSVEDSLEARELSREDDGESPHGPGQVLWWKLGVLPFKERVWESNMQTALLRKCDCPNWSLRGVYDMKVGFCDYQNGSECLSSSRADVERCNSWLRGPDASVDNRWVGLRKGQVWIKEAWERGVCVSEHVRAEKIMQLIKLFRCRDIPRSMWKIESMIQRRCDFYHYEHARHPRRERGAPNNLHFTIRGAPSSRTLSSWTFARNRNCFNFCESFYVFEVLQRLEQQSRSVWVLVPRGCMSVQGRWHFGSARKMFPCFWRVCLDVRTFSQELHRPQNAFSWQRVFKPSQHCSNHIVKLVIIHDNPACSVCWREFARQTSFQSFHTKLQVAHACTKEDTLMLTFSINVHGHVQRDVAAATIVWRKEVAARK